MFLCLMSCASPPAPFEGLVETPSGKIFVRSGGEGSDLVLLHGLGDSCAGWYKIEDELRRSGYRVTVWDALGAGRSEKPVPGDYRLAAHFDRLTIVLDHLGIERATIVGNSLGGTLALMLAQADPNRVEQLVLLSPAAYPEGGWLGDWLWGTKGLAEQALELLPPSLIATLALQMNFGDASRITIKDQAVYSAEAGRDGVIRAFVEQQRQLMPSEEEIARFVSGLRSIRIRTLILWGTRDRVLDPRLAERLDRDLPQARLVYLDGVGHVAQLEAPQRVIDEILRFLKR